MTELRDTPSAGWTIGAIEDAYEAWLEEHHRSGPRPCAQAVAVAIYYRMRRRTWRECAELAGVRSSTHLITATRKAIERLALGDLVDEGVPVGLEAGAPWDSEVDEDPSRPPSHLIARVVWAVATSTHRCLTGAPRDVARDIGVPQLAEAERILRHLHNEKTIRFAAFSLPTGHRRWSVVVPLKIRGENLNHNDDKGAA